MVATYHICQLDVIRGDRTWASSSSQLSGSYFQDTIGFGPNIKLDKADIVLIKDMDPKFTPRIQNGNLGLFVNSANDTERSLSLITKLWESGQLLNPVIGMRFNPLNPKLTLGALDPADYEGEINWVQLETPDASWDLPNVFKVDGFRGYNGSFFPSGSNDNLAGISSLFNNIAIPNNWPYINVDGYHGPISGGIATDPERLDFFYQCNTSTPYVAMSTVINGVDYQIDSKDNLLQTSFINRDYCPVALQNNSAGTGIPGITFGVPFLRSVYVAYRFPTGDCPGYYGFAFPSGANRTQSQISQKPTSTPSLSSQCLSLTTPTSTPTFSPNSARKDMSQTIYEVYGMPGAAQVPLVGVDDLPKGVWNQSQP